MLKPERRRKQRNKLETGHAVHGSFDHRHFLERGHRQLLLRSYHVFTLFRLQFTALHLTSTMGKKKRGHPDIEEVLARPWCYYCERDFDDLKILISHQKAKHYKCDRCGRRLNTAGGMLMRVSEICSILTKSRFVCSHEPSTQGESDYGGKCSTQSLRS